MKKKLIQLLMLALICSLTLWMSACSRDDEEDLEDYGGTEAEELEEEDEDAPLRTDPADELEEGDTLSDEFKPRELEESIGVFAGEGYKRTADGGFTIKEIDDDIVSERTIHASGNHLIVELSYEYGSDADNKRMRDFFKENPDDAVSIMVASFLTRVADAANALEGDMDYTISVAGKAAAAGHMTLEEADQFVAMADEVY